MADGICLLNHDPGHDAQQQVDQRREIGMIHQPRDHEQHHGCHQYQARDPDPGLVPGDKLSPRQAGDGHGRDHIDAPHDQGSQTRGLGAANPDSGTFSRADQMPHHQRHQAQQAGSGECE